MGCQRLNEPRSSYTCFQAQDTTACRLHVALIIIAACGFALSACALVSYTPPSVGYSGAIICILSITALMISNIRCWTPIKSQNSDRISDRAVADQQPSVHQVKSPSKAIVLQNHASKCQSPGTEKKSTSTFWERMTKQLPYVGSLLYPPFQPFDRFPTELSINVFRYLEAHDLVIASRVCKVWREQALADGLWKTLCLQESVCPPEGELVLSQPYKTYDQAKKWMYRLQQETFKASQIQIPAPSNIDFYDRKPLIFFKTKELFFFYYPIYRGHVEIWDVSLNTRFLVKDLETYDLCNIQIKCIKNVIYLIGSTSYHTVSASHHTIHVYAFDTITKTFLHTMRFPRQRSNNCEFALNDRKAFIGQENGVIDIWDLASESTSLERDIINYEAIFPYGGSFDEEAWKASYSKTNEIEVELWVAQRATRQGKAVEDIREDNGEERFYMEEGAYYRCMEEDHHRHHQIIQNRKKLMGHTKAINALCTTSECLFSSSQDGTIKQWDLINYQCMKTIETGFRTGAWSLQVAGHYVFGLGNRGRTIHQWNMETKECFFQINLQTCCDSFHIIGNLLFCLYRLNSIATIEIYDLCKKKCIRTLTHERKHPSSDIHLQVSNNCLYLLDGSELVKWDFSSLS